MRIKESSEIYLCIGVVLALSCALVKADSNMESQALELKEIVVTSDGRSKSLIGIADSASQGEISQA